MARSASSTRLRQKIALLLNLAVVGMELIGLWLSIREHGLSLFQFYTEDSNLFAMLACGIYAFYIAKQLKAGASGLPAWVRLLSYTATSCLMVTFVVVLAILIPMEGADGFRIMLLSGSMLYHHLLCPLALLASLFFQPGPPFTGRQTLLTLAPTLVYAAIVLTLNIQKALVGPYPFLHVYEQPVWLSIVWFTVILGGAYLLAWLLRIANRRLA